jgi:hypothetical protein
MWPIVSTWLIGRLGRQKSQLLSCHVPRIESITLARRLADCHTFSVKHLGTLNEDFSFPETVYTESP